MNTQARMSILGNLSRAFLKHKKNIVARYFNEATKIQRKNVVNFSDKQLKKYCEFINWKDDSIPATFPYTLLTHMQFSMVTDKKFPFSPFGLIHKSERIETFFPLRKGRWEMNCRIPLFRKVDKGYEIEIISTLKIDGIVAWRSTTTAFKQTRKGLSRYRFEPINTQKLSKWNLGPHHGFKYALLSNNFDLIHISKYSAKLMGLKKPIMHGMFTAARGLSELNSVTYPFKIDFRFVAPVYLPAQINFQRLENGFNVYSKDGKRLHLEANIL